MTKPKPKVTLEVSITEIKPNITEMFDVSTARERIIKYFKGITGFLQHNGVPYERDLTIAVEVIAEFNNDVVCTEVFVCDELMPDREYHEKFSNALNAMVILRDTIKNMNSDINHLGKLTQDGRYGKSALQSDFEKLQKAHETQTDYMLELVKELQKNYKMY